MGNCVGLGNLKLGMECSEVFQWWLVGEFLSTWSTLPVLLSLDFVVGVPIMLEMLKGNFGFL